MTMHRHAQLMIAAILSAVLGAGLDIAALRARFGIEGVAWAMFVTYAATGALMLWLAARALALDLRSAFGLVARAFAPLVLAIGIATALDRLVPGKLGTAPIVAGGRVVLNVALFAGVYALGVWPLVRGLGLRRALAEARLPGFGSAGSGGAEGTGP
jgi:Na+-driven multidrug efflux pump